MGRAALMATAAHGGQRVVMAVAMTVLGTDGLQKVLGQLLKVAAGGVEADLWVDLDETADSGQVTS